MCSTEPLGLDRLDLHVAAVSQKEGVDSDSFRFNPEEKELTLDDEIED